MDHFTLVCDLIVFHIFDFLPLIDLASIGLTNKRLNKLANDYFNRKYSSKAINQIIVHSYNPRVHPSLKAIQCFRNHFQSIYVDVKTPSTSLTQFLSSICGENVKTIEIYPELVESNAELLNKMESVYLLWTGSPVDCDNILANCQHVKHFGSYRIPENFYTELKSFRYFGRVRNVDEANKIIQFLQRNPQIQKYERSSSRNRDSIMAELKIFEYCVNIEKICIDFNDYDIEDLLKVVKPLKILSKRYNLKSLKIGLRDCYYRLKSKRNISNFAALSPILEALSISNTEPFYSVLAKFPFDNIKYLEIALGGNDIPESYAEQITENLPNLEVLYTFYIKLKIFKPFICRSKKLKKLCMEVHNVQSDFLNSISSCIKERKQLEGACKLTICLFEDQKDVKKELILKSGDIADVIITTESSNYQYTCKYNIGDIDKWQDLIPINDF